MKADHLANYTMDVRRSWHQFCPMPSSDVSLTEANFILHFDGGTREEDCSAAAWILEARVVQDCRLMIFPVAYCGKFLHPPVSSFLAEAIALESCTEIFSNLILKLMDNGPCPKRMRFA